MTTKLPEPVLERFQPLRSGLINLYKYENQEFWFERGRLLLRGNNGSGKSRVLALQLPFLFDGEISPHRVEPDGDPAKAFAWNLLMSQYDDRLGYTWIEFGRQPRSGPAQFVTLGCGIRAIKGVDGLPNRWYFVTGQRIGLDFSLVTENRQPLSRDQLVNAIGETAVYRTAQDYRREVDCRLFGLKARYEGLIELLIRLRAPQLARKLDEQRLSSALSDALPPLSDALIGDVAESFSNLDSLRADLLDHRQMHSEVGDFLQDYCRYLQVAARRRAETVRSQHSRYEDTNREIAERTRYKEIAADRVSAAEVAKRTAELAEQDAEAQIEALRDSPFQRDAIALENAHKHAELCRSQLVHTTEDVTARDRRFQDALLEMVDKENRCDQLSKELSNVLAEMGKAAQAASFLGEHERHLPAITAWPDRAEWLIETKAVLELRAGRHAEAISHLMQRQATCVGAQKALQQAQEREIAIEQQVSSEREIERQLEEQLRSLSEQLAADYATWVTSLIWLRPENSSDIAEGLLKWLETGSPIDRTLPGILERAVTNAEGERRSELARVDKRLEEFEQQIASLSCEQNDLEMGRHTPPPVPTTRDPEIRKQIDGMPLWQVCDFRNELDEAKRAALEAALESSGLLDALITPDGILKISEACDTYLFTAQSSFPMPNLNLWLRPSLPADESGARLLTVDAVERALQFVGTSRECGEHWVSLDGEWQLGPLKGRGRKRTAEHLGEGAREDFRRRRLTQIATEILVLTTEKQHIEEWREDIRTGRVAAIRDEREKAPSDHSIATALERRSAARERLAEARRNYESSQAVSMAERQAYQSAVANRDREASDLGLSEWQHQPDLLQDRWQNYRLLSERLWPTARFWDDARRQVGHASENLELARGDAVTAKNRLQEAESKSVEADARYNTLYANTGASVANLHSQTSVAKTKLEQAQQGARVATGELMTAKNDEVRAQEQLQQLSDKLDVIVHDRGLAIEKLHLLARHNLFPDAHAAFGEFEAGPWSVTRGVEIAREIDKALRETRADEDAWLNHQTILFQRFNELQTSLGTHGHQPQMEYADDSLVAIACPFHGRPLRLGQLQAALADEISTQERLLTEREREAIDNHLIGEVATTLQELIRDAETKVTDMNEEITRCSTSTGLTMRLRWEPRTEEVPEGLPEARALLLADSELWSPEERKQLGQFLHGLIKDARAANPLGVWNDHLRQALDYRAWHTFAVERRQNDKWEKLTKRRYGTGSGGEKALMLTVPQMAAAAAHYRSSASHAPRLILLDEVFVGIDSKVRAKCMGLLEAFDLDFMMTSEREWGAYPTIKGLAIYQLTTRPGIDAIATTRWVWNGQRKIQADPAPFEYAENSNGKKDYVGQP
jgi:uncharacterized protein (TIGR02680 family)